MAGCSQHERCWYEKEVTQSSIELQANIGSKYPNDFVVVDLEWQKKVNLCSPILRKLWTRNKTSDVCWETYSCESVLLAIAFRGGIFLIYFTGVCYVVVPVAC